MGTRLFYPWCDPLPHTHLHMDKTSQIRKSTNLPSVMLNIFVTYFIFGANINVINFPLSRIQSWIIHCFSCHIFLVSCVLEQFSVFVFHEIVIFVEYEPVVYWNPPKWCFLLVRFGVMWLCSISFFQEHWTSDVWSFSVIYIRSHIMSIFFIVPTFFFQWWWKFNYMLSVYLMSPLLTFFTLVVSNGDFSP